MEAQVNRSIIFLVILLASCSSSTVTVVVEENSPVTQGSELLENIGIETLGGVFTPLLQSGCNLPCEISQVFSTAEDNQSQITITIVRGSEKMANKGKYLGKYQISGISPAPLGVPQIEVIFQASGGNILLSVKDKERMSNLKLVKVE